MYRRPVTICLLILGLLALTVTTAAQGTTLTEPPNPNANISWPPPVYVLRGQFTLRGSANLPNMTGYFIEFRALNADLTEPIPELWLPATLPNTSAVQDSELGTWDTRGVPDGIYELRLTVNVLTGTPVTQIIGPVRVENTPPPFAVTPLAATAAPLPPLQATPTAFDTTPRVTSNLNANVRSGDGTSYPVIGGLLEGETAPIVGISSLGTGWYLIELANGSRGWVSPSVVTVSGDISSVPRVEPPPPPLPTAIPATPTPISTVNLVAGNFHFDPGSPKCKQTFNIYIDVANFGSSPSPSGIVGIQDLRRADGSLQGSTIGAFPVIQPGQTISVGPIPLTINTFYNEEHRLVMSVDPANQIPETNEGDNVKEAAYTLDKAACP
jgi:SH3 domain-containing protein/CARDB protein